MAYDGLAVAACVKEFNELLSGGKITKVIQPEKDELQLFIRKQRESFRLQISVNPSLPLCCLTDDSKPAPLTAPSFCMALRKHIGNGSLLRVRQPAQDLSEHGLERVLLFDIEHLDEMGDLCRRILSVELMGKYSNIILLREDGSIIDSIKRISLSQSSVREVLPNRPYFIPDSAGKENPLSVSWEDFLRVLSESPEPLFQALFHRLTGFSAQLSQELCFRAGIDPDFPASAQDERELRRLYDCLRAFLKDTVEKGNFCPNILYRKEVPQDFSAVLPESFLTDESYRLRRFSSMSEVIRSFYSEKDRSSRLRQKSTDLRKVLNTLLERSSKKLSLQEKQLRDTAGKDKYRIYGELLNTYGYSLEGGETELRCENYYDGKEICIPLKKELSATENAKHYFERYDKLKRTEENLKRQLEESRGELRHLQSILSSLELSETEAELQDIRREMEDFGFLKRSSAKGKVRMQEKSSPYHFVSSDGFDIYVGKNNYQNEQVSFRIADGGDLWLHAKNVPGSHVIVKTGGASFEELPDRLFLEAAALAAWFSSHRDDARVEVDYTIRKNLRKVPNAAPGFVIYHTNYSVTVAPGLLPEAN